MKIFYYSMMLLFFASMSAQKKIPNITINDINGKAVQTENVFNNDEITIVALWATWCVPCMNELNAFNDKYDQWKKSNIKIVAVSIDDARTIKRVKPLVNGKGWYFDIYLDTNHDLKRALNVSTVPYLFVVKDNKIVYTKTNYTPGSETELFNKINSL